MYSTQHKLQSHCLFSNNITVQSIAFKYPDRIFNEITNILTFLISLPNSYSKITRLEQNKSRGHPQTFNLQKFIKNLKNAELLGKKIKSILLSRHIDEYLSDNLVLWKSVYKYFYKKWSISNFLELLIC